MSDGLGLPPLTDRLDASLSGTTNVGAVHIAHTELRARTHELPPKDRLIRVVAGGEDALPVLAELGRRAVREDTPPDFNAGPLRMWEPNGFLERALPNEPVMNALELACGSGREAVYLASLGWHVTAIDHLPDALEKAVDLELRYSPAGAPRIHWQQADVTQICFEEDWSLVTCFFYLDRALLQRALARLRPGGWFVHETFTRKNIELFGKPRREGLSWQPLELLQFARDSGLVVEQYEEGLSGGRHTARIRARRPQ
jgi:SAM-dependent methyltransferase